MFESKKRKMCWNCNRWLFKSPKLLASRAWNSCRQKPVRRLHNPPLKLNILNLYMYVHVGCLHGARSVSSFCDFWKMTFCNFTAFFLPFHTGTRSCFFRCSYWRVLKIICVQILILMGGDFSVALKKWQVSLDAQCVLFLMNFYGYAVLV